MWPRSKIVPWPEASTGPPSIEGGKTSQSCRRQARRVPCFNGAALNRGRKGGLTRRSTRALPRFNGAALNRGRKAWSGLSSSPASSSSLQRGRPQSRAESLVRLVVVTSVVILASTGPPSIEGGKPGPACRRHQRRHPRFNGAALNRGRKAWSGLSSSPASSSSLQRGRPQSRAERPRGSADRARGAALQRGRPQSRAERIPASDSRAPPVSFNGAALNRGRKAGPGRCPPATGWLQRGRPQSRAESGSARHGTRRPRASFNGAALNRGRKAAIPITQAQTDHRASTGPPSIEGGKCRAS
ncbi:Periplasmic thiol disulfide interchange protein DsbA [Enhygromyxa salina]|uniref:Periplasmic thiol disulfide interchange protein DsbA n=1 Tax=Enhygromyxa salina TaxID=215803 RepID=A0A0C1ZN81_9BACT|nr:Periplasmic thiol disulfide interchange protein DsbA [Enhygromyxa salina]